MTDLLTYIIYGAVVEERVVYLYSRYNKLLLHYYVIKYSLICYFIIKNGIKPYQPIINGKCIDPLRYNKI